MKPVFLLFTFALLASCTYTQKVKDGNFAFERKQYAVAVELLQTEYKKEKSWVAKGRREFLLGESSQMMHHPASAQPWYTISYYTSYG